MASKKKKNKEFILYAFLVSELRKSFRKTPMYRECLNNAKEEYFVETKNGSLVRRVHFKCAKCGKYFLNKPGMREIAVDHIDPVVCPFTGWVDWNTYVSRMYCPTSKLQVLCNYKKERNGVKSCHYQKTQEEKKQRTITQNKLKAEGKDIKTKNR